jgi:hypothetical protein
LGSGANRAGNPDSRDLSKKGPPTPVRLPGADGKEGDSVEGRLRTREFEMKNNGGKRQRMEIVASRVQFLGPACAKDRRERYR